MECKQKDCRYFILEKGIVQETDREGYDQWTHNGGGADYRLEDEVAREGHKYLIVTYFDGEVELSNEVVLERGEFFRTAFIDQQADGQQELLPDGFTYPSFADATFMHGKIISTLNSDPDSTPVGIALSA